jgi:hypothetical protein
MAITHIQLGHDEPTEGWRGAAQLFNLKSVSLVERFNFFTPSFSEKLPLLFTQEVYLKISEILITFYSTFVTLLKIVQIFHKNAGKFMNSPATFSVKNV